VIVAQGGLPGGWTIYARAGRLCYAYNFYGVSTYEVESVEPLPEGTHRVTMAFEYDGGGVAKGGTVRLSVDGREVGQGRVARTQPLPFASDEPFEIGRDLGSPVSRRYVSHTFTGDVHWVEIEIPDGAADDDGAISPEERLEAALAKD
jgi:arylsulfatase